MSDTEKIEKIVELIKNLSLLEAFELVKSLEKTFGIDASAYARAAAPAAPAAGGGAAAPAAEEKSEFDVILDDGSYAEVLDGKGQKWALHASGDGDFVSHRIRFEALS